MKWASAATARKATIPAAGTPMTAAAVQPAWVSSMAETTVPKAMTEPTERSMPPIRMTMVMPVAAKPVIATCRSTSVRLP